MLWQHGSNQKKTYSTWNRKTKDPKDHKDPMPTGHEKIHKQTLVWSKLHQWIFHIAASIKHEPWFTWNEPFQTFVCCIVEHVSIRCFESNITIDETVWTVYWRGIIYICINCIFCLIHFFSLTHLQWKASSWRTLELKSFTMDWVLVCFLSPGIVLEIKILSPRPANFKCHCIFGTDVRNFQQGAVQVTRHVMSKSADKRILGLHPRKTIASRFNGNKQIHRFM